ncbi:MAG TPA: amino acid permease [Gemmatimonadaceae bacterium]|nr:amino acid permease [Gemmatimonadaceae bacterium]
MPDATPSAQLARRLGVFDATMIVMGGIVGAGIFINPYVVAQQVHTPGLILGAWAAGGLIALAGAFVYAELAQLRPQVGGQYAYLRDAFHPMVAFLYGWGLLLVTQTGGMAAVAMTFANYFGELTGVGTSPSAVAVLVLLVLTGVNCLGVRSGSNVQSALMVTKIVAVLALVVVGWWVVQPVTAMGASAVVRGNKPVPIAFAAAMVPVLFAYGGWQTASFVSGELKNPVRDLPRGLLIGVVGVVLLYLAVNVVCLRVLGVDGLASTRTPASAVMQRAWGAIGAKLIAAGIAVSTVGFLSQGMLTAPRVYYAMARDGVFFRAVGWLDRRSRVPTVAIALQGLWAAVIALSGRYDQILNYVVSMDAVFFGLTGAALLVLRRRERVDEKPSPGMGMEGRASAAAATVTMRMPGHPWTTLVFVVAFWALALSTILQFPGASGVGVLIMVAGIPVYWVWARRRPRGAD